MIGNLLRPELAELIRQRDFNQLREILCDFPAPDVAEILTDLSPEDKAILLRILPQAVAAEVFEYLSVDDQEKLVQAMGNEQVAAILNDVAADDRTALLEELPSAVTQKLLNLLSPEQRKIATELLGFPKDSIGRRMTPEYVAIRQDWTVADVLEHLRHESAKRQAMNQLYVVDEQGHLVDFVRLRDLVVKPASTPITDLLAGMAIWLHAADDQEKAVSAFRKYDVTILPVLDSKDVLVGVVTVDDVLDVAEKEATEDIQKLGGMEALDAPYLKIGLLSMVKKRAGWLALLFMGEMLTATAMGYFEGEIEKAVILSIFLPLIISSGGNSGSQATSLIIRSLAVGDVTLADWWRVLRRELVAGLLLGCALAVLGFSRIWVWQLLGLKDYGEYHGLIAITVAASLVGVILFGSICGAMLPFFLRMIRFDPAVASAPLVATLVDVTGLVIYFTAASQILSSTLLKPSTAGIVVMEHEKSADSFGRFLGIKNSDDAPEVWSVKRIEWHQTNDTIVVTLADGEKVAQATECGTQGKKVDVAAHKPASHWTVPEKLLGHKVEVVCELPVLKTHDDGQPCELTKPLPWETKLNAALVAP